MVPPGSLASAIRHRPRAWYSLTALTAVSVCARPASPQPKQINEIKDFLLTARRKDAKCEAPRCLPPHTRDKENAAARLQGERRPQANHQSSACRVPDAAAGIAAVNWQQGGAASLGRERLTPERQAAPWRWAARVWWRCGVVADYIVSRPLPQLGGEAQQNVRRGTRWPDGSLAVGGRARCSVWLSEALRATSVASHMTRLSRGPAHPSPLPCSRQDQEVEGRCEVQGALQQVLVHSVREGSGEGGQVEAVAAAGLDRQGHLNGSGARAAERAAPRVVPIRELLLSRSCCVGLSCLRLARATVVV